jgi:hypothetical protein
VIWSRRHRAGFDRRVMLRTGASRMEDMLSAPVD